MIIQINGDTAIQINLFRKEECLENEMSEFECSQCYINNVESHIKGAEQIINILGDHYTALFLQHLILNANKKLEEDDKKFNSKHAFEIKPKS